MSSPSHQGRCTCSYVQYELMSEPMFVHCCHCSACQREGGGSWKELFQKEQARPHPPTTTTPTTTPHHTRLLPRMQALAASEGGMQQSLPETTMQSSLPSVCGLTNSGAQLCAASPHSSRSTRPPTPAYRPPRQREPDAPVGRRLHRGRARSMRCRGACV